jgi:uncharacterized protein
MHEAETSNEIVLVTTDTYFPDTSILFYSVNFGRSYGVGKKDLNNGIVIVYSDAQRQVRINTGFGLENILKDEMAKKILDSIMVPHFKAGDLYLGLWQGRVALVQFLERPENRIKSE